MRLDLLGGDRTHAGAHRGLTDFHGQLEQTSYTIDGRNVSGWRRRPTGDDVQSGGRAILRPVVLVASGDNVGASPANSGLLEDRPAIDVENAWGLHATSYGNHEFDYGVARLLQHQARAHFPFLGANIVDEVTLQNPNWVQGTHVFNYGNSRIGVIGIELKRRPLVSAGATAGLKFLDEVETIKAESERLRKQGVKIQVVLIHQGTANGLNAVDGNPAVPWEGQS